MKYLLLLRGVNVGGKNKVSMAKLVELLGAARYTDVKTYINSGNILLRSDSDKDSVCRSVERILQANFKLDAKLVKVCALSLAELEQIVTKAPQDFEKNPELYYRDVLFPMDISASSIMAITETNPEVDKAWNDNGVVYYQRLGELRTKSRLNRLIAHPEYKSTTMRSWSTTKKLFELLRA